MNDLTPLPRGATRFSRLRAAIEDLIFGPPDLDAVARGWEVHRPTPFRRVYRDPRWHSIVACDDCRGSGFDGTLACPVCDGRGTVRLVDADATAVP
jgi:hypothetical protein